MTSWVAADHHFGHAKVINFTRDDGTLSRPFSSIEEHDETIIANHNALVDPNDRVYMVGDVCINKRNLPIVSRLNGRLVLVKGNHDTFKLQEYMKYFEDIRAYVVKKGVIISHIPVHPNELERFKTNIHGHMHHKKLDDSRYVCVSLEHTNYKPVELIPI